MQCPSVEVRQYSLSFEYSEMTLTNLAGNRGSDLADTKVTHQEKVGRALDEIYDCACLRLGYENRDDTRGVQI